MGQSARLPGRRLPGRRFLMGHPAWLELSEEHFRILRAVRDGRIVPNDSGRYVIDGEPRPNRKAREQLVKRHMIVWVHRFGSAGRSGYELSTLGFDALRANEAPCLSL
jgi:hypothetical protein